MNHDQHIQHIRDGQDIEKIELVDIEELRSALGAEADLAPAEDQVAATPGDTYMCPRLW